MILQFKSIKTKITLSFLAIVIFGLVPYEISNYINTQRRLNTELEILADRTILRLNESLIIPLWEMDDDWIGKLIDSEMLDDNLYGMLVSGDENLFAGRMRNDHWQSMVMLERSIKGDFIERSQDIIRDQLPIGKVHLYFSKRLIEKKLKYEALKSITRTLALIFLIVLFLRLMINHLIINPLSKILEALKAISQGDYRYALKWPGIDEIGELVKGVNEMKQNLLMRKTERDLMTEELTRANETLEQRVHERTADLEIINADLQKLTIAYEKAKNDAESANKAKSIFLANMTHELRTPMNAVLGFSRLMQEDREINSIQREYLDIINRSGNHLLELINNVLDMAKIESGRMIAQNTPFDLEGLIRDSVDMMHERAESKGLALNLDPNSKYPRFVSADVAKIRHVLINLLSNAIKYTQQGQIILRVTAESIITSEQQRLIFEVEDSGIGISEQDLARIFDAFVQLGPQSEQQGSGLGLVITKQFVELMGGQIQVSSIKGSGSLFRVELPATVMPESAFKALNDISHQRVIGLAPNQPCYRVLIAEDQAESRLLLRKILEAVGFQVIEAINGAEAVELFKQFHPEFIWMDKRMPVMDGIEATKAILALPGGDKVKIAAVTASVYLEERLELLRAGVCTIINKPYRNEEIFECMQHQLGIRFIYEETETPPAKAVQSNKNVLIEKLGTLPDELLATLENSVIELDIEQSIDIIDHISLLETELAHKLRELINQFDFETVLRLIQTSKK